jgi:phosphocarrier protein
MRYESRITIELRDGSTHANAKSVLSVLAAGVRCGDEIRICCDGADEEEALEALGSIFETNE